MLKMSALKLLLVANIRYQQVIIPNYLVIYSLGWEHISIHPGLLVTLKCNDLGQVPMKYIMKLFISSIRSKKLTTKAKE